MTDKQMTEYLEKIDRVIENGEYKADWGSLAEIGAWTKKNAKAIWGTQPYKVFGEGKKQKAGSFNEHFSYTSKDYRFTCKTGVVYAFALKPKGRSEFKIKSLADSMDLFHCIIKNITVLGSGEKVLFSQNKNALTIRLGEKIKDTMPICFKIEVD